jgi:hypothetical protein
MIAKTPPPATNVNRLEHLFFQESESALTGQIELAWEWGSNLTFYFWSYSPKKHCLARLKSL